MPVSARYSPLITSRSVVLRYMKSAPHSGVYLLPEWGVAYICNSTGKNDPTYKSYALYDDSSLANGGAWRNSRVRSLTEVLPYLRDPSTQDPAVWSAQALNIAVQVARTQGGSFGAYRDPLATPIGLLLLDEAKKYAMPTQTFRRNGRHWNSGSPMKWTDGPTVPHMG